MGVLFYDSQHNRKRFTWTSVKLSDEQLMSDSYLQSYLEELKLADLLISNKVGENYIEQANERFNAACRDIISRINDMENGNAIANVEYSNRLFVDMDGTIARFHDEVNYLEQMYEKGFFLNLNPFTNMINGLKVYMEQHPETEVFILSATIDGEPPHCMREKDAWLERFLPEVKPENRLFVPMGADKSAYIPHGISEKDTLLDDYNVNLDAWQKAGGNPVKCKNNINHRGTIGPLWVGKLIDNNMQPDEIAQRLERCIENELSRNDEDIEI